MSWLISLIFFIMALCFSNVEFARSPSPRLSPPPIVAPINLSPASFSVISSGVTHLIAVLSVLLSFIVVDGGAGFVPLVFDLLGFPAVFCFSRGS